MSSLGGGTTTGGSLSASSIVVGKIGGSGSHILRIEGYSLTKGLGNDYYIASEKFIAGGHRWCLLYYPNGGRDSDPVAISLNCFDLEEVEADFTISLLDRDSCPVPEYSCAYCHRFKYLNLDEEWGGELMKRSGLERSAYLKDYTFWVRCDVTVQNKIFTSAIPVSEVPGGGAADRVVKKMMKRVRSSSGEC